MAEPLDDFLDGPDCSWEGLRTALGYERAVEFADVLSAMNIALLIDRAQIDAAIGHVPHETFATEYDRHQVALGHAAIILVAKLDNRLDRLFCNLWERRRDMLHNWLKNQPECSPSPSDVRRREGLWVSIEDLWSPSSRHQPIERFFRDLVVKIWREKSPMKKLEVLLGLLKPSVIEQDLTVVRALIALRNRVAHPPITLFPDEVPQSERSRPVDSFVRMAKGYAAVTTGLEQATRAVTNRWIATNDPHLSTQLADEQQVAFSTWGRDCGMHYSKLEMLLAEATGENRQRADLVVLEATGEIASKTQALLEFANAEPRIPVLVCETGHVSLTKDDYTRLLVDIDSLRPVVVLRRQHTGADFTRYPAELQGQIKKLTGIGPRTRA